MLYTRCASDPAVLLAIAAPSAQQPSIDDFFRELSDGWVRLNPNLAVQPRYFSGEEQDRLEQQISSYSAAAERQRLEYIQRGLARPRPVRSLADDRRAAAVGRRAALSPAVVRRFGEVRRLHLSARSVQRREHLAAEHAHGAAPAARREGRLQLRRSPAPRRPAHGRSCRRISPAGGKGFDSAALHSPPDDRSDAPFRGDAAGAESARDVARRARRRDQRSDADARAALVAEAERIVRESVYPEWNKAIAYLETLVPRSADRAGLWRLEGGAAAYAHFLKAFTTTNLTPDQIHEIGLQKVDELERNMDAILRKLGRSNGTVKERVAQLKKDLSYPTTEDGRQADHGRHRRHDPRSRAPFGAAVRREAERPGHRAAVSAIPRGERRCVTTRRRLSMARGRQSFRCRCAPIR